MRDGGFQIINLPLIQTLPLDDLSDFEAKIAVIENYDGIFLTSRRAVEILRDKNINFGGKVYVLGRRGFDTLKTRNFNLIFDDAANTAREFLGKIPVKDLENKRFLFIRGKQSLRVIPEFLARIAEIDEAVVYRAEKVLIASEKAKEIKEKFKKSEIAAACFFSPSAGESFIEQFGAEIQHQTKIAVIGKTTAEFFERRNLQIDFIASRATAEDFAVELIEYLGKLSTDEHR